MKSFEPRPHQAIAFDFSMRRPRSGLFLEMALGKTAIMLWQIAELIHWYGVTRKVLIIAPKKVAEVTWVDEAKSWEQTQHLRITAIKGDEPKRIKALSQPSEVYTIGANNVSWLIQHLGTGWNFDMVVIDESSLFKNHDSGRFKALRTVLSYCQRVVLLTGTPSPNGLLDLWAQVYLLDGGARLGKTFESYRDKYFTATKTMKVRNKSGAVQLKHGGYQPDEGAEALILSKISDICLSMKTSDHLTLPPCYMVPYYVDLSPETLQKYTALERDSILSVEGADVVADTAAALTGKLLQLGLGFAYTEQDGAYYFHNAVLDALSQTYQDADTPVLVFYTFTSDRDRILERFPEAELLQTAEQIERWNAGQIPMLVAHPASAGHGLNLQFGGRWLIWYGLTWNLEHFLQGNKRLHRPGQKDPVNIVMLIPRGTMHEDVYQRLQLKEQTQDGVMEALNARKQRYLQNQQLAQSFVPGLAQF